MELKFSAYFDWHVPSEFLERRQPPIAAQHERLFTLSLTAVGLRDDYRHDRPSTVVGVAFNAEEKKAASRVACHLSRSRTQPQQ